MDGKYELIKKIVIWIEISIYENLNDFKGSIDSMIQEKGHETLFLLHDIEQLLKTVSYKINHNISGKELYRYSEELEPVREGNTVSKQIVGNISFDTNALWVFVSDKLKEFHFKEETDDVKIEKELSEKYSEVFNKTWVNETINLNANLYYKRMLTDWYETLKFNDKKSYSIYSADLNKRLRKNKQSYSKIEPFEWTSNISNLGFIFHLLQKKGYIKYPKGDTELAANSILELFGVDRSQKDSLIAYLSEDSKFTEKEETFRNGFSKESLKEGYKIKPNEKIFILPKREFLRKGKH